MKAESCGECLCAGYEPPAGLRERELAVLCELASGDDAQVGFQGLRRRLDLHQESLRRTLRRLQRDGYVAKRQYGYGLTEKGLGIFEGRPDTELRSKAVPVAHVLLPAHLSVERVVEDLSGRWFRNLRWYGVQQGPGEVTMIWESEPEGKQLRLRLRMGAASAEVAGGTANDEELADAASVLRSLLELVRLEKREEAEAVLANAGGFTNFAG